MTKNSDTFKKFKLYCFQQKQKFQNEVYKVKQEHFVSFTAIIHFSTPPVYDVCGFTCSEAQLNLKNPKSKQKHTQKTT